MVEALATMSVFHCPSRDFIGDNKEAYQKALLTEFARQFVSGFYAGASAVRAGEDLTLLDLPEWHPSLAAELLDMISHPPTPKP
jgi:hypothetical protein